MSDTSQWNYSKSGCLSFQVLQDAVKSNELREEEAARIAKDILFHTANRVYHLELEPLYFPS